MVIFFAIAALAFETCFKGIAECNLAPEGGEIRVAAAADLGRAFTEIARSFEKETGAKVTLVFGSTGLLAKQIESGAPFDLFAAADEKYVVELEKKGRIVPHSRHLYATGRLVIVSGPRVPVPGSLKYLTRPEFRKIAIANPAHAPYGVAAEEALRRTGILDRVRSKLVFGENVQHTLRYVDSGAAEAAIVSLSLVNGTDRKFTAIETGLYKPLRQALAVIESSKNEALARQFAEYVLSAKGRITLKRYGFLLPGDKAP
jgi:molybdate transport system substrate-binding protein